MTDMLNIGEVFQLAVQIETNAVAFYGKAAETFGGEHAAVLQNLAAMEAQHKATFEQMRDACRDMEVSSSAPSPEGGAFLAAVADGFRLEGSAAAARKLTGSETLSELLTAAIGLEKDAVVFYIGIRDVVSDARVRDQLNAVIREEQSHIVQLAETKRRLKNGA